MEERSFVMLSKIRTQVGISKDRHMMAKKKKVRIVRLELIPAQSTSGFQWLLVSEMQKQPQSSACTTC